MNTMLAERAPILPPTQAGNSGGQPPEVPRAAVASPEPLEPPRFSPNIAHLTYDKENELQLGVPVKIGNLAVFKANESAERPSQN